MHQERDMSETQSYTIDSEDDASSSLSHGSESSMTTDDCRRNNSNSMNLMDGGRDEKSAGEKAYSNIFLFSKRN